MRRGFRREDGDHESEDFDEALDALGDVIGEPTTVVLRDVQRCDYVTMYGRLQGGMSDAKSSGFRLGEARYFVLHRETFERARWGCEAEGMSWAVTFKFTGLTVQIGDNLNRHGL